MTNKINILYDGVHLGRGVSKEGSGQRAGVFRFSSEMLYALLANDDCITSICCQKLNEIYLFKLFLDITPELRGLSIAHTDEILSLSELKHDTLIKIGRGGTFLEKFPLKIQRKLLQWKSVWINAEKYPLDYQTLYKSDIFFSPGDPFSQQVTELPNLKRFITIHDLILILHPEFFGENGTKYNISHEKLIKGLNPDDWINCVSYSTKNDLCNYRKDLNPDKILVTHLAASDYFYECKDQNTIEDARNKYQIPEGKYVLSLSTLEPRKNIEHVIRSFSKLVRQEKIQDLNLVLVGSEGWNFDKIYSEISEASDLKGRIIKTGFVPDEDLAALYSGALVFTYMSKYEGFGLPPLEAMQCGLPVIVANNSSLPEVVGDAAIKLNYQDSDGLCNAISDFYRNSSLRLEFKQKSLKQAKKFTWKKSAENLVTGFKRALGLGLGSFFYKLFQFIWLV